MRRVIRRVAGLEDGWCSETRRRSRGGRSGGTLSPAKRRNECRRRERIGQPLDLTDTWNRRVGRESFGGSQIEDWMPVAVGGM
jgi:hypothetical protein